MNKKLLYLIPLMGISIIPQLLFYWLDSKAECRTAVHLFVTVMTLVHLLSSYFLWYTKGTRRSAPVIVIGTIITLLIIIVGGGMLLGNASNRTAIFAMSILVVVYLIMFSMLIFMMENDECISEEDTVTNEIRNNVSEYCYTQEEFGDHSEKKSNRTSNYNYNDNQKSVSMPPPLPKQ